MNIMAPGCRIEDDILRNSTAVAIIHTHPVSDRRASSFSDADIQAWQTFVPNGNLYVITSECNIYIFDRETRRHEGIFVTAFIPNALGGNWMPYKFVTSLLN